MSSRIRIDDSPVCFTTVPSFPASSYLSGTMFPAALRGGRIRTRVPVGMVCAMSFTSWIGCVASWPHLSNTSLTGARRPRREDLNMLRFLPCFDRLTHHVEEVLGLFFLRDGIGNDTKADAGRRFNLDIVPLFVSVEKNHDPVRQGGAANRAIPLPAPGIRTGSAARPKFRVRLP